MTSVTALAPPAEVRPYTWRSSALVAILAGSLGWAGALGGRKGVGALACAAILGVALVLSDRRRELATFASVLASAAIVHKNFSLLSPVSSGPPSIYLTSVDVMVGLLYFLWVIEGTVLEDLRRVWRLPMVRAPLWGALLMAPSIVVSPDLVLTLALLLRMASLYALFLYVAARTRTRQDVWVVLGAVATLGVLELVVVLGQWLTGGALGLSFLGVPAELGQRITDDATLGRPFGTIIHPVFMGAFLGIIALLALSVAIHLQDRRIKAAALLVSAAATLPMVISHTRSALLAVTAAGLLLVVVSLYRSRLAPNTAARWVAVAAVAGVLLYPQISTLWSDNLKSEHFSLEVDSRFELNRIAIDMIKDAPLVGHGPNGFEQVMGEYDTFGLIFADNPVHNLFLLQLAETGVIGFAGLLLVGLSLAAGSLRLLQARDPLHVAVAAGFGAVLVFFAVEEQFVFSLRQDHPATLFWVAAGLLAACTSQSIDHAGREARRAAPIPASEPWSPAHRAASVTTPPAHLVRESPSPPAHLAVAPPRRPRPSLGAHVLPVAPWHRRHGRGAVRTAVGLALIGLFGSVVVPASAGVDAFAGARVVLTLRARSDDSRSIWTMDADGTDLTRVTPADDLVYSWSEWAFNGTKIVFTARRGGPGSPEGIYLMDPDGSNVERLTDNPWQNGQPRVSPDGTHLLFTSAWEEFERFALYSMDLSTGLVSNLSARSSQSGSVDADPKWTPDGRILFAASADATGAVIPTQIGLMAADGSGRTFLSHDEHFNTDPEMSPGGDAVAWAAYRGTGGPGGDPGQPLDVKLFDWFLVTKDLATGEERALNEGRDCSVRLVTEPCGPLEGPAFIPNWSPDGSSIAYLSILSRRRVCVCTVGRDGSDPGVLFASEDDEVQWFDIIEPGGAPEHGPDEIRSHAPASRLLLGGVDPEGVPLLAAAVPDRFGEVPIGGLAATLLSPQSARWSADRAQIAFSAVLPNAQEPVGYGPAPPPGEHRHRHFTLSFVSQYFFPAVDREGASRRQVFVMDADGTGARQLTTATMEDYLDAIPDGEVRGNVEPAFSPDGRYLVVVNVAEASRESFLLRIDLRTGAVLSLTNGTAGALPVADFNPVWSPNSERVAFATAIGGAVQIATVDRSGLGYRQITDDDFVNVSPSWSPDGRELVYASYRGEEPIVVEADPLTGSPAQLRQEGWVLVKVDVATGRQTVLTGPEHSPTLRPVWSPEGDRIAFISVSGPPLQPDVWVVGADGSDPHPLQVTLRTKETSVDWR